MKFLKENWFGIFILIFIIGFAIYYFRDANIDKRKLKEKDIKIQEKVEAIGKKEVEVNRLMKEGIALLDDAIKYKAGMLRGEVKLARMRETKIKPLEKIKKLPPNEVVFETKKKLNCNEIWLKQEGILFSLTCAKKNLEILEGFDLLRNEHRQLKFNYKESKKVIFKLEGTVRTIFKANLAQEKIIFDWKDISKKKDEKIAIIANAKKKSYWKGFLTGAGVGIFIVIGLKIVLGR